MKFNTWEEYAEYCKSVYYDFKDDISWIKHISSHEIIDEPKILENLCMGTPGIFCIQEDNDMTCDQCLLENIDELKEMLYMSASNR